MMLRLFRPDLLSMLTGFVLGTVALLAHASLASPPPPPPHTDILAQAGPTARYHRAG